MKVVVFGGRDWDDYDTLSSTLDLLHAKLKFTEVMHGNALGADYLAGLWARNRMIPVREFPADWSKYGTKAGPIRNEQILREGRPQLGVAFPGGRGTNDMLKRCKKHGIEVHIVGEFRS